MKCIVILNQSASRKSVFWKRSFAISVTVLVKPKKMCERGGVYLPILLSGEEYYMPVFFLVIFKNLFLILVVYASSRSTNAI